MARTEADAATGGAEASVTSSNARADAFASEAGGASGGSDAAPTGAPCEPNTRWCDGNTPVRCPANGFSQSDASCTGATPLCRDGACVACGGTGGPTMVAVDSFCIDSTEVTQAQYHAWLDAKPGIAQQPSECAWNNSYEPPELSCTLSSVVCQWWDPECHEHPQVCVDWCDARAYCESVGKRLCGALTSGPATYDDPSTGQWRAACGGVYPYGDILNAIACNPAAPAPTGTVAVASLPACVAMHGGHAVYDLTGNVHEWEDSCSGQTGAADTCRARGGSFFDSATQNTCEALPNPPFRRDLVASDLGFRCCSLGARK